MGLAVPSRGARRARFTATHAFLLVCRDLDLEQRICTHVPQPALARASPRSSAAILRFRLRFSCSSLPHLNPPTPKAALRACLAAGVIARPCELWFRSRSQWRYSFCDSYTAPCPIWDSCFITCLGFQSDFASTKVPRTKRYPKASSWTVHLLGVSNRGTGPLYAICFIPLLFHTSEFSGYGPCFSILMIGMIATQSSLSSLQHPGRDPRGGRVSLALRRRRLVLLCPR